MSNLVHSLGILCPECESDDTRVITTHKDRGVVERERLCKACHAVFPTVEVPFQEDDRCPRCAAASKVEKTRKHVEHVRRRRVCEQCGSTYQTRETHHEHPYRN